MGWNYLSIPKLQRLHRWSLGMDKQFHPTFCNGCNYLSMLGLKLNYDSKRGPWNPDTKNILNWTDNNVLFIDEKRQVVTWLMRWSTIKCKQSHAIPTAREGGHETMREGEGDGERRGRADRQRQSNRQTEKETNNDAQTLLWVFSFYVGMISKQVIVRYRKGRFFKIHMNLV